MRALFPLLMLLLSACSNLPMAIKEAPSPDWQLSQVAVEAEQHKGEVIRWGDKWLKWKMMIMAQRFMLYSFH